MLEVRNLTKEYRIYEEESGIRFFRKKKRIAALDNYSWINQPLDWMSEHRSS